MPERPESSLPPANRKMWVRRLIIAGVVAVSLCTLVVIGLLMYFNDAYFKARLQEAIKAELGRDSEVGAFHLSLFSGDVSIENFRLLNATAKFTEKETLRLARLSAHVDVWPLLASSFKKVSGVKVELNKPEFIVEARGIYPMEARNIDDLVKKFTSGPKGTWPKNTNLQALDFDITIRDGSVSYKDSERSLGLTRIEKLNVNARLPGLGQAMVTSGTLALVTPSTPAGGTAKIDGKILWIDAAGKIDPAAFKDVLFTSTVKDLDVPHITRHLRMEGELSDGEMNVSLGKPASGSLKFEAASFSKTRFSLDMETDGAISIWRDGKRIAGDLPSRTVIDAQGGWANGQIENGPVHYDMFIAATRAQLHDPAAPKLLELQLDASEGKDASARYVVLFKSRMDDLFATDVGVALSLKDQIGGNIDGKIEAVVADGGNFSAEGTLKTTQGYVRIQEVRQPTAMDVAFSAKTVPDKFGSPNGAEVSFSAAANSFKVSSLQPVVINSLVTPKNLSAKAKLQLHIDGREFWKQFGPLLKVANLSTPLEETLDGELQISGSAGKLTLNLDSTLRHQKEPESPIKLQVKADYDGEALVDNPVRPFTNFAVQLRSAADKSINIQMEGAATRGKSQQVVDLPLYRASGDLAVLNTLNARFGAYVRVFLGPEYTVTGNFTQSGSSKFVKSFGADGKEVSQELTLSTEMQLADFKLSGPKNWADKQLALQLGMNLKEGNGERKIVLKPLKFTSDALNLSGELAEADIDKLAAAASAQPVSIDKWIAALPECTIDAQVTVGGIKQLQANAILSNEPLMVGELTLSAGYNAQTRHASVSNLTFTGSVAKVRSTAPDIDLAALAPLAGAQGLSLVQYVKAFPGITLDAQIGSQGVARLQELKLIPAEPLIVGDLLLKSNYDAKENKAVISKLIFNSSQLALNISTADSNVVVAAAAADNPAAGTAKFIPSLPDLAVQAIVRPGAIASLQARGILPNDPALAGEINLNGTYDRNSRQLKLETFKFSGPSAECAATSPGIDLTKVGAFLDLPEPKRDLNAMLQLLPDMQLELSAKPPLFAFLETQKMMIFDPNVSGDLTLKARYEQASDNLNVETLRFARAPKSNGPILALDMAVSAGNLKKLPATLELLKAPAVPLTVLLSHLDKGVTINSLVVAPHELCGLLRRQAIAADFMDDALNGIYTFAGPLTIQKLRLQPAGAGVVTVAFDAQTPLDWRPPVAPSRTPGAATALSLRGVWRFSPETPLRVNVNPGLFSASGTLALDDCGIDCKAAQPFFPYQKAAAVPCKLAFSVSQNADTLSVLSLALSGGPLDFTLSNLSYSPGAGKPVVALEALVMKEGPLKGSLSGVRLDAGKDQLRADVACESVDLAQFIAPDKLTPNFRVGGMISGLQASYDGPLSALSKDLGAAATKVALRCSRIDATLTGTEPGKIVTLNIQGDLSTDGARVNSKFIRLGVNYSPAGKAASTHNLMLVPDVSSKTGEPLLSALKKPGLPLVVKIQGGADGDVNVDMLGEAFTALAAAATPQAAVKPAAPGDFSAINQLRLEFKFDGKAGQSISMGTLVLRDLKITSMVLDNLKAELAGVSTGIFADGAANVKRASYDLSTKAYSTDFEATNIDLHLLSGGAKGKTKDDYQVFGRLWGGGKFAGVGFERAERKTWNGDVKARIADLVAMKNEGKESFSFTKLGTKLGTKAGGIFLESRGLGGVASKIDWATAIYTEDFGLFLNKMEFEPFEAGVSVVNGTAKVARTTLMGKGKSSGLQLDFAGDIALASEAFAPQFTIWLRKLPPKTQQVLRLDQIDEADRNRILAEFDESKFQPIILSGPIATYKTNDLAIASAFNRLDNEIQRLIDAKKAREAAQQAPASDPNATTPPPANSAATTTPPKETTPTPEKPKDKKIGIDDIFDLLKRTKD